MATTQWSIWGRVGSRIELDSSWTSGMGVMIVEDVRNDVQNITGQSINLADIGSQWHGVLTNMSALLALSKQTGIGADFNYKLGNFQVSKGGKDDPNSKQMVWLAQLSSNSLKAIGKPMKFDKSEPSG